MELKRALVRLVAAALLFSVVSGRGSAATFNVDAGGTAPVFTPNQLSIQPGDTVIWTWRGSMAHSVTSGTGTPSGLFDSGIHSPPFTFSRTFPNAGTFDYYCIPHGDFGMAGQIVVGSGTAPAPAQPLNVSTRMRVETGDNVLIGGFIVLGTEPKRVVVRAIGPSLSVNGAPLPGRLQDSTLELVGPSGSIATNDNWRTGGQEAEIIATTVAPTSDLESAIVAILPAASNGIGYTAIVRGVNGGTGVGLVEVYDLNQPAASRLANISTRGPVQTGDNVMIGGFILGGSANPTRILARALGPSLAPGVSGALANPTLELRDSQGTLVRNNDDWRSDQQAEIQATLIPPTNDLESALIATLTPGAYTAVMAGKNGGTGVGLVEIYQLQ
ncbi:MAG: plastocyanin/azurin family copper-binding protein [Chthoniobacterales bacterium]